MPSDLLKGGNGRFCSRRSAAQRLPLVGPGTCRQTIEFQHILLLTSTGLLMEGVIYAETRTKPSTAEQLPRLLVMKVN
jgi:hypothetical protein